MNYRLLLILFMMILRLSALSYDHIDSLSSHFRNSISLDLRPSYAFSSYKDDILSDILNLENVKDTRIGTSIHLQYGFSFPQESSQGRICPDAWQGIGASVSFFGNHNGVGTPVTLYAFQGAPIWRFSERLSAYYEWNFGASFGWHPCDLEKAGSNLIVGSRVNAYINLGAGLMFRLSERYSLMAGVNLTHYSNGNTSFPNPGVNLAGLRVGVVVKPPVSFKGKNKSQFSQCSPFRMFWGPEIDIMVYSSLRKRVYRGGDSPVLLPGHFAVAGLDISPMWRVTRNFRAGASVDIQWDESTALRRHYVGGTETSDIRFNRPPIFSQVCIGLSGRTELVMPLFSVNVGIGYNIIGPEETRASYQLANLKMRLTDALFINIGYQLLDFQKQNNLMLGLGYTFRL